MYGQGILKGLGVTFKHFFATYVEDIRRMGGKMSSDDKFARRQGVDSDGLYTVQYPEEKIATPERFRFLPFLVTNDDDHPTAPGEIWCTACGICPKVCPPQCIWILRSEDPVTKRPVPKPQSFFIDMDICMNCGYCMEFCPFDAIKMDQVFELSTTDRFDKLLLKKTDLAKPNTYFHQIHPTDANEVDGRLGEEKRKAEEKAKAAAAAAAAKAAATAAPAKTAVPGAPDAKPEPPPAGDATKPFPM